MRAKASAGREIHDVLGDVVFIVLHSTMKTKPLTIKAIALKKPQDKSPRLYISHHVRFIVIILIRIEWNFEIVDFFTLTVRFFQSESQIVRMKMKTAIVKAIY
jgi:hypothetical protein